MNKDNASLQIGLSSNSVTVLRVSGWLHRHTELISDEPIDSHSERQLHNDLGKALADSRCTGLPTVITLADGWTRLFLVTPPPDAANLDDCRAVTAQRFKLLYGDSPEPWLIEADWDASQPFLACGMPRSISAALRKVTKEHGLKLLGIAPQFVFAWNQYRKTQKLVEWFGTLHIGSNSLRSSGCRSPSATIGSGSKKSVLFSCAYKV